jgi:hypothetical protein
MPAPKLLKKIELNEKAFTEFIENALNNALANVVEYAAQDLDAYMQEELVHFLRGRIQKDAISLVENTFDVTIARKK